MTSSEFINKFKSKYLWGNIGAMILVLVLLCAGVKYGIDIYTHHGEAIRVPDIRYKNIDDATHILDDAGLEIVVTDTGYVRSLPSDVILEQTPVFGEVVKSGHVIYVTINSDHSPRITIPDVIDNSSLREAMAKLTAMGFKLGTPEYIPGEEDWVYGILVKGDVYKRQNVEYVTRVPYGEMGEAALMHLREYGLNVSHVVRGGERLGTYYFEEAVAMRNSRVVYDRKNSSFYTLKRGMVKWDKVLADAAVFH